MTSYYTLITSLPRHSKHYKIKQTPISRIQLEKRLKILPEQKRLLLTNLTYCIWDSWFNPKLPLAKTKLNSKNLLALNIPFINELIQWFFDVRSVFVALRLRKVQQTPPINPQDFWSTRWNIRLISNWNVHDFGLKYVYPWLPEVSSKMSANETDDVEDIILNVLWKHLDNIESRHFYDFEAIVIYILRWHIVNYWSQFNEKTAYDRIRKLSNKILKQAHIDIPLQTIDESDQNQGVIHE